MAQYKITYTRMDDTGARLADFVAVLDFDVDTPDDVYNIIRERPKENELVHKELQNLRKSMIKRIERLA